MPIATDVAIVNGTQAGNGVVQITYPLATSDPSASSLGFPGTQAQGTTSAPEALTITNNGSAPLLLSGLSFTGPDAGDFLVGSSTCYGPVPAGESCIVTIDFAPQGEGTRTATLSISSNAKSSPASVALEGTGGGLPAGPLGPAGPAGAAGAAGPAGAAGASAAAPATPVSPAIVPAGPSPAALHGRVSCTVAKQDVGERVTCTMRYSASVAALSATLSRGARVYAHAKASRAGRTQRLVLNTRQTIAKGRYTLVVRGAHGTETFTVMLA